LRGIASLDPKVIVTHRDPATEDAARQYAVVAAAIDYLRARATCQPSLDEVASAVHLSPHHLQRVFTRWAGISPKRFLQYLTKEHARAQLARSSDCLNTAAAVGLSGGGRLHDLMVSCEALTPGEIQSGGRGLVVGYGTGLTPFGVAQVAWTARGICHLAFAPSDAAAADEGAADNVSADEAAGPPVSLWPQAQFQRDDARAATLLAQVFAATRAQQPLRLVLRGTNFQIKVWEALLRTGTGDLVTYADLAQAIGQPKAARAVGSAVAANLIGYLIPCHRVIRGSGDTGQYRWGAARKQAMLGWEAARAERTTG
jgi:AraC family transcriptional regulator of adaptative response/methylated-DNA-[protein]-cysteine methyltransferase